MEQSLPLRLLRSLFNKVLLEDGELPCVLPLAVQLDLGHLPDNQGYLGLLSEPCTLHRPRGPDPLKVMGWLGGGQEDSSDSPEDKLPFPFFWICLSENWGVDLGLGLGLVNSWLINKQYIDTSNTRLFFFILLLKANISNSYYEYYCQY